MNEQADVLDQSLWRRISQRSELGVIVALILLILYMSYANEYFLKPSNIFNVLRNMSTIAIMSIGMTMIIVTGGIDLSVGSTMGLSAVLMARMLHDGNFFLTGFSPWVAVPCGFLMGIFVGLLNGVIITKLHVNPFITTMGMLSIGRGSIYLLATGLKGSVATNIPMRNEFVTFLGQGRIYEVPAPVIIAAILVVLFSMFLKYTVLGRQIYAVGSNAEAARLTGVNVNLIKVFVYTLTGGLCAVAGFISAGLTGVGATNAGVGNELDVIAAVIIGGTSLSGGEGTIFGAVIGAAIMAVIKNAFVLLHLPTYSQTISIGVVIIVAVAIDSIRVSRVGK